MNNVFKKIIKNSLYVFLIISLIMTFTIIASYTYIIGWIVGSFVSVTSFGLSFIIMNNFNFHNKNKKQGFGFGLLRIFVILIYQAIFVIAIMSINAYFSGEKIFSSKIQSIVNPINFYTYLFGIGLIPISVITWGLWYMWKEKNAKIHRRN